MSQYIMHWSHTHGQYAWHDSDHMKTQGILLMYVLIIVEYFIRKRTGVTYGALGKRNKWRAMSIKIPLEQTNF